jgi:hypothetical protein
MCALASAVSVGRVQGASEIASELRDEVLQTILAVRLNLAHAVARDDYTGVLKCAAEAQDHLASEAVRVRGLIESLEALEAAEPDAVV